MGYIVFQKGVIQFAMAFLKKLLLFKEEGLNVSRKPTLSQILSRGCFPGAHL